LPYQCAIDFSRHAAFSDVAVGADAHIQKTSVRAGGQCLGPVMVDGGGQVGNFVRRTAGLGLAVLIIESHQRILVGDVKIVVDQREAVGCVEIVGENGLLLIGAVAIAVA